MKDHNLYYSLKLEHPDISLPEKLVFVSLHSLRRFVLCSQCSLSVCVRVLYVCVRVCASAYVRVAESDTQTVTLHVSRDQAMLAFVSHG